MSAPKVAGVDKNVSRLMEIVHSDVTKYWGLAWADLSPTFQSALLSERLLALLDQLDESIDPTSVVHILSQGRTWISEVTNR